MVARWVCNCGADRFKIKDMDTQEGRKHCRVCQRCGKTYYRKVVWIYAGSLHEYTEEEDQIDAVKEDQIGTTG